MNSVKGTYSESIQSEYRQKQEKCGVQEGNSGFRSIIQEKVSAAASASGHPDMNSTADMTLEKYKAYIQDKIAKFPIHPSQGKTSFSVNISDAAYEAMKNDPEYEQWVLDVVRAEFGSYDPVGGTYGGKYSVHYFGATKEEYRGHSWNKENPRNRSDDCAREYARRKRAKRKRMLKELYEKHLEKKRKLKELYEEHLEKKQLMEELYDAHLNKMQKSREIYEEHLEEENLDKLFYEQEEYETYLTEKYAAYTNQMELLNKNKETLHTDGNNSIDCL